MISGYSAKLSEHTAQRAEATRETARGYRDMRNMLFVVLTGATALSNAYEDINSLPPVDQIKFNAAGLAIASLSATGMEWGRRKRERHATTLDKLSKELANEDL